MQVFFRSLHAPPKNRQIKNELGTPNPDIIPKFYRTSSEESEDKIVLESGTPNSEILDSGFQNGAYLVARPKESQLPSPKIIVSPWTGSALRLVVNNLILVLSPSLVGTILMLSGKKAYGAYIRISSLID